MLCYRSDVSASSGETQLITVAHHAHLMTIADDGNDVCTNHRAALEVRVLVNTGSTMPDSSLITTKHYVHEKDGPRRQFQRVISPGGIAARLGHILQDIWTTEHPASDRMDIPMDTPHWSCRKQGNCFLGPWNPKILLHVVPIPRENGRHRHETDIEKKEKGPSSRKRSKTTGSS